MNIIKRNAKITQLRYHQLWSTLCIFVHAFSESCVRFDKDENYIAGIVPVLKTKQFIFFLR